MSTSAVEAVIVGRTDLGESDRIVRLLSAAHGRIDAVARGARASKKRFGGALELGTVVHAHLRRGKGSLATLTGVDVITMPRRAREDYDRLMLVAYGCDVTAALSEHGLATPKGFGLLRAWLDAMEAETVDAVAQRLAFEAKALTFSGLAPQLVRCAVCGERLEGTVVFDCEAGGGTHTAHGDGAAVEARALLHLEALRRTPLKDCLGVEVPGEARWLLTDFIEYQVRAGLPSRALLSPWEAM